MARKKPSAAQMAARAKFSALRKGKKPVGMKKVRGMKKKGK